VRQREVLVSSAGSKIPLAAGEAGDAANESTRELALLEDERGLTPNESVGEA
jgi:hypothetical protein